MKEKKFKKVKVIKKPAVRKVSAAGACLPVRQGSVSGSKKPVLKDIEQKSDLSLIALHNLKCPFGAHKKKKLLGRGSGSGHGKTSTRGSKGQTSRAGRHFYLGFEGGQSPLIRKMPKRGFVSNFKKAYQVVNLEKLNKIKETVITPQILKDGGLIRDERLLIKILGKGSIKNPLTIQAHAFSKHAAQEIVSAGGKVEIINT